MLRIPLRGERSSEEYWTLIRNLAAALNSDGCTGVPELYHDCCLEHDIHYRLGIRLSGEIGTPISRADADARFRQCIQERSRLGRISPLSWIRWIGVRLFGMMAWRKYRKRPLRGKRLAQIACMIAEYALQQEQRMETVKEARRVPRASNHHS